MSTHHGAAFTLIEVILAIALMAVVMAAVSPALVGALRAERQARELLEPLAMQQVAFARFIEDVQAAPQSVSSTAALLTLEQSTLNGNNGSSLYVLRDANPAIDPEIARRPADAGQRKVTWVVKDSSDNTGLSWVRQSDGNVLSTIATEPSDEIMLGNLAKLSIEALDGGSWYDTYDSFDNGYFPRALRVTYAYRLRDGSEGPTRIMIVDLPMTALTAPSAEVVE